MTGEARPRLAKKARLKLVPMDHRQVLLAPERGLVLSESAGAIVARCDGLRTVDEIARALAEETHAPFDDVRSDVMAFVTEMTRRGFLELG
jgi:pyrroloquinoline quinone biosynthesis protein D